MATSAGVPVPHPIDMNGGLGNNQDIFKESQTNYEIATELDMKNERKLE